MSLSWQVPGAAATNASDEQTSEDTTKVCGHDEVGDCDVVGVLDGAFVGGINCRT